MKIKMQAYVYHIWLDRSNLTTEALAKYLQFGLTVPKEYVRLGEVEIDFEILPQEQIVDGMIVALKQQVAEVRAAATARCTAIEGQIQQLLSIENNPTKEAP